MLNNTYEVKLLNLFVFVLFLLTIYYPVYLFLSLAAMMIYFKKLDNIITLLFVAFLMTFLFYLREYGLVFSAEAQDDVPHYVTAYLYMENGDFRYIIFFEPLYVLFMKFCGFISNYNVKFYIFVDYFLSIFVFLYALKKYFNEKYLLGFLFVISFGSVYFYETMHILRQSMALSVGLLAIYYASQKKNKTAISFFVISTLLHYSLVIFLVTYVIYYLLTSKITLSKKIFIFIFISIIVYISAYYINFILIKLESYSTKKVVTIGVMQYIKFIFMICLSGYFFLKSFKHQDMILRLLSFYILVGGFIMLSFAGMDAITDRIGMIYKILFIILIYYILISKIHPKKLMQTGVILATLVQFILITQEDNVQKYLLVENFNKIFYISINNLIYLKPKNLE